MVGAREKLRVRSDFDGLYNMPEVGADAFFQMYSGYIAAHLGISTRNLSAIFRDARQRILLEPEKHGWFFNGRLVCPWYADHYQEAKAIAYAGLDIIRSTRFPTLYEVPSRLDTHDFLNDAFQAVQTHIIAPPRPGAADALQELNASTNFGLISNSETDNVQRGLIAIFKGNETKADRIKKIGDAKKFKIDPRYTKIRASLNVPGLKRRPFLRRKQFLETLRREGAEVYIEDVAEFLYAPVVSGILGILVETKRTRPYEIAFFKKNPKGRVVERLKPNGEPFTSGVNLVGLVKMVNSL